MFLFNSFIYSFIHFFFSLQRKMVYTNILPALPTPTSHVGPWILNILLKAWRICWAELRRLGFPSICFRRRMSRWRSWKASEISSMLSLADVSTKAQDNSRANCRPSDVVTFLSWSRSVLFPISTQCTLVLFTWSRYCFVSRASLKLSLSFTA